MSQPGGPSDRASPEVNEALAAEHGLSSAEYASICERLGRTPTLEELGVFSVMWSEHCSYKSSRPYLSRLPQSGPRVLQGPGENAGAVDIGGGTAAIFKIESHNHPSFIEPYQGAATGVGGILRDIFTMGARPVANLNSLRFGTATHARTPFLLSGVVAGIGGYGNSVGVPTVGGEVYFDEGYDNNILVNAFSLGVVPADGIFRAAASGVGNSVLYVGSKTGRDGIHGASLLASSEFKEASEQMRPTVQVGDPFTENLLIEACLEALAGDDVVAIQDMGAAGLTCSSIEMAERGGVGIRLDLDRIPLRDPSLSAYEILLSESQERMLLVARKGGEARLAEVFTRWGLDCVAVGEVTDDGRFCASRHGADVCTIPVSTLDEPPAAPRPVAEPAKTAERLDLDRIIEPEDLGSELLALLASPNLCSRAWVYQQYDSYVGASTLVQPGGDAAVVQVRENGTALAITADCNSRYVALDPYTGTQHAVAEAVRNVAATGARPLALSDCLNFGNPEKPEIMWQFARSIAGLAEACRVFETPVVSGNVSFYNDTRGASIPPTPVVAMVGLIADPRAVATVGLGQEGQAIYLLGGGRPEFEGSEYLFQRHQLTGDRPPAIDLATERATSLVCVDLIASGLVTTAHDVAEGGLAVALAELCLAGAGPGLAVEIAGEGRADLALFGESGCRFLLAVDEDKVPAVERTVSTAGVPLRRLGTSGGPSLVVTTGNGTPSAKTLVDIDLEELRRGWQQTLPQIASGA